MEEKRLLIIRSKQRLGLKFKRRINDLNYQKDRLISFCTARTSTISAKPMVTDEENKISRVDFEARHNQKEIDAKMLNKQETSHTSLISDKDRIPQPIVCENEKVVDTSGNWYHSHLNQEIGNTYASLGGPFNLLPTAAFYPLQSFSLVMYGTLSYGMMMPYRVSNYGGINRSAKE